MYKQDSFKRINSEENETYCTISNFKIINKQ